MLKKSFFYGKIGRDWKLKLYPSAGENPKYMHGGGRIPRRGVRSLGLILVARRAMFCNQDNVNKPFLLF